MFYMHKLSVGLLIVAANVGVGMWGGGGCPNPTDGVGQPGDRRDTGTQLHSSANRGDSRTDRPDTKPSDTLYNNNPVPQDDQYCKWFNLCGS